MKNEKHVIASEARQSPSSWRLLRSFLPRNDAGFFLVLTTLIFTSCNQGSETNFELPEKVTFNEHVAPIIHGNCSPCHRPDGGAPFPMMEYRDVAKRAKMIAEVTADRYMPPWPADPHYRSFLGERYLSERQIAMLAKWVDDGRLEGEGTAPEPPHFETGSMFGEPDLVVTLDDSVFIEGNNLDKFMVMKIPFELPKDTFIRLIEFVPGNRELVHHMNGHLITYEFDKKEDVFDGKHVVTDIDGSTKETYEILSIANDDGTFPTLTPSVSNYLPSVLPVLYPEGIGTYGVSRKSAFLIKNMHYGPTPIDAYDRSYFNVFYADGPPKRPVQEWMLGTLGISEVVPPLVVPPDEVMKVETNFTVPQDVSLLTINPHMHLIGRSFKAWATTPSGEEIPLISIPKWDFRWQYFYTFHEMLKIPKGSIIHAEGVYDNTLDNPNNPYDPPKTVVEPVNRDMKTTDEMFQFIITYLPYQVGDENISLEPASSPSKQ
ncbi:MAG: c-type cytochrome [Flavobacteriales bacterium]